MLKLLALIRGAMFAPLLDRRFSSNFLDYPQSPKFAHRGIPAVGINDRQAANEIATHLLNLHHKRVAIIAMDFIPDAYTGLVDSRRLANATYQITLLRLQGYRDAISKAGINFNQVPIYECHNDENNAYAAALTLLNFNPRPTGILAMSDMLAYGAFRAAEKLGLNIPQDLSVVGFDDIPLASQVRPTLTTIQQPLVEKGAIAAKLLLSEVKQNTYILKTKLLVRESTAVAPIIM